MAYVVTKFLKYHSNVVGDIIESSPPDSIILPDGERVTTSDENRTDAICSNEELAKSGKMIPLNDQVSFKILSTFDNDCNRNGSIIRWKVPKGAELVWLEKDCFS